MWPATDSHRLLQCLGHKPSSVSSLGAHWVGILHLSLPALSFRITLRTDGWGRCSWKCKFAFMVTEAFPFHSKNIS